MKAEWLTKAHDPNQSYRNWVLLAGCEGGELELVWNRHAEITLDHAYYATGLHADGISPLQIDSVQGDAHLTCRMEPGSGVLLELMHSSRDFADTGAARPIEVGQWVHRGRGQSIESGTLSVPRQALVRVPGHAASASGALVDFRTRERRLESATGEGPDDRRFDLVWRGLRTLQLVRQPRCTDALRVAFADEPIQLRAGQLQTATGRSLAQDLHTVLPGQLFADFELQGPVSFVSAIASSRPGENPAWARHLCVARMNPVSEAEVQLHPNGNLYVTWTGWPDDVEHFTLRVAMICGRNTIPSGFCIHRISRGYYKEHQGIRIPQTQWRQLFPERWRGRIVLEFCVDVCDLANTTELFTTPFRMETNVKGIR